MWADWGEGAGIPHVLGGVGCLPTQDACPVPCQGPIHIGAGCLVTGLDAAHSKALHGRELRDLVLQGHHTRLHGSLGHAFTLVGRLDSWEVGSHPAFPHPQLQALGSPRSPGPHPTAGFSEHWPVGQAVRRVGCTEERMREEIG